MEENLNLPVAESEAAVSPKTEKAAPKKGGRRSSHLRTMELFFEPVFDNHLNMAIDFEVTVRLNDTKMGVLLPEAYIPVAEKSNRICDINRWTIEECCDVLRRAEERDASINSLILNISVRYLAKPYFVKQVIKILEKKEVDPDKFCFNLNESIYQSESEQVKKNIVELRDYGFKISIDDFGVQFTSISNLALYKVDYIGIHRSLVEVLTPSAYEDEDKPRAVVQGLIDFAKKVGSHTRVGGIDTEEMAVLLRKMGADQLKGAAYHTSLWQEKQIK